MSNSKRMNRIGFLWSVNDDSIYTNTDRQETPDESTKDALRIATGCSRKEIEEWQKEYLAESYN